MLLPLMLLLQYLHQLIFLPAPKLMIAAPTQREPRRKWYLRDVWYSFREQSREGERVTQSDERISIERVNQSDERAHFDR